jgi:hypothetical protein
MKSCFLFIGTIFALLAGANPGLAQGTAFTYQGRLNDGGQAASGNYDLTFRLFGANSGGSSIAGPLTNSATAVTNGLFTVTLDFGGAFDGTARWLEIGVRTNGSGGFTTLSPRQSLTPAPYAIFANSASNLTGTLPASQLSGQVNASYLGGLIASYFLNLTNQTGTLSTAQLPPGIIITNSTGVLAADFELDETSGSTFADSSGFGNTATSLIGGIAPGSAGHSGKSINFSGGVLKVPAGRIPDSPQIWVEAWVFPQFPTNGTHTIVSKTGAYTLQLTGNLASFVVTAANGTATSTSSVPVALQVWSHVAGWYDGLNVVAEVNGTVATAAFPGGPVIAAVNSPFYLGAADDAGNQAFFGNIDEVRIRTVAPVITNQRHIFYVLGSATDATVSGPLSARSVTFTKISSASRLRIAYSDNFGVLSAGKAATWEVRLDGASLPIPLMNTLFNNAAAGTGTPAYQPGSLAGYATGISAGVHNVTVYVSTTPGFSGANPYTGSNSSFLLEVEEIQ